VAVQMGTVFPGDATTVEGTLATALPPGHYTVAADLSDATPGVAAQSVDFPINVAAPPTLSPPPCPSPWAANRCRHRQPLAYPPPWSSASSFSPCSPAYLPPPQGRTCAAAGRPPEMDP